MPYKALKGLIRPFKGLIRPFKGLIRPFKGLSLLEGLWERIFIISPRVLLFLLG